MPLTKHLALTFLALAASCAFAAEETFTILAPSRDSSTRIPVITVVKGDKVKLTKGLQLPLEFPPTTIAASAPKPLFYVTGNQVVEGQPAAAVVRRSGLRIVIAEEGQRLGDGSGAPQRVFDEVLGLGAEVA